MKLLTLRYYLTLFAIAIEVTRGQFYPQTGYLGRYQWCETSDECADQACDPGVPNICDCFEDLLGNEGCLPGSKFCDCDGPPVFEQYKQACEDSYQCDDSLCPNGGTNQCDCYADIKANGVCPFNSKFCECDGRLVYRLLNPGEACESSEQCDDSVCYGHFISICNCYENQAVNGVCLPGTKICECKEPSVLELTSRRRKKTIGEGCETSDECDDSECPANVSNECDCYEDEEVNGMCPPYTKICECEEIVATELTARGRKKTIGGVCETSDECDDSECPLNGTNECNCYEDEEVNGKCPPDTKICECEEPVASELTTRGRKNTIGEECDTSDECDDSECPKNITNTCNCYEDEEVNGECPPDTKICECEETTVMELTTRGRKKTIGEVCETSDECDDSECSLNVTNECNCYEDEEINGKCPPNTKICECEEAPAIELTTRGRKKTIGEECETSDECDDSECPENITNTCNCYEDEEVNGKCPPNTKICECEEAPVIELTARGYKKGIGEECETSDECDDSECPKNITNTCNCYEDEEVNGECNPGTKICECEEPELTMRGRKKTIGEECETSDECDNSECPGIITNECDCYEEEKLNGKCLPDTKFCECEEATFFKTTTTSSSFNSENELVTEHLTTDYAARSFSNKTPFRRVIESSNDERIEANESVDESRPGLRLPTAGFGVVSATDKPKKRIVDRFRGEALKLFNAGNRILRTRKPSDKQPVRTRLSEMRPHNERDSSTTLVTDNTITISVDETKSQWSKTTRKLGTKRSFLGEFILDKVRDRKRSRNKTTIKTTVSETETSLLERSKLDLISEVTSNTPSLRDGTTKPYDNDRSKIRVFIDELRNRRTRIPPKKQTIVIAKSTTNTPSLRDGTTKPYDNDRHKIRLFIDKLRNRRTRNPSNKPTITAKSTSNFPSKLLTDDIREISKETTPDLIPNTPKSRNNNDTLVDRVKVLIRNFKNESVLRGIGELLSNRRKSAFKSETLFTNDVPTTYSSIKFEYKTPTSLTESYVTNLFNTPGETKPESDKGLLSGHLLRIFGDKLRPDNFKDSLKTNYVKVTTNKPPSSYDELSSKSTESVAKKSQTKGMPPNKSRLNNNGGLLSSHVLRRFREELSNRGAGDSLKGNTNTNQPSTSFEEYSRNDYHTETTTNNPQSSKSTETRAKKSQTKPRKSRPNSNVGLLSGHIFGRFREHSSNRGSGGSLKVNTNTYQPSTDENYHVETTTYHSSHTNDELFSKSTETEATKSQTKKIARNKSRPNSNVGLLPGHIFGRFREDSSNRGSGEPLKVNTNTYQPSTDEYYHVETTTYHPMDTNDELFSKSTESRTKKIPTNKPRDKSNKGLLSGNIMRIFGGESRPRGSKESLKVETNTDRPLRTTNNPETKTSPMTKLLPHKSRPASIGHLRNNFRFRGFGESRTVETKIIEEEALNKNNNESKIGTPLEDSSTTNDLRNNFSSGLFHEEYSNSSPNHPRTSRLIGFTILESSTDSTTEKLTSSLPIAKTRASGNEGIWNRNLRKLFRGNLRPRVAPRLSKTGSSTESSSERESYASTVKKSTTDKNMKAIKNNKSRLIIPMQMYIGSNLSYKTHVSNRTILINETKRINKINSRLSDYKPPEIFDEEFATESASNSKSQITPTNILNEGISNKSTATSSFTINVENYSIGKRILKHGLLARVNENLKTTKSANLLMVPKTDWDVLDVSEESKRISTDSTNNKLTWQSLSSTYVSLPKTRPSIESETRTTITEGLTTARELTAKKLFSTKPDYKNKPDPVKNEFRLIRHRLLGRRREQLPKDKSNSTTSASTLRKSNTVFEESTIISKETTANKLSETSTRVSSSTTSQLHTVGISGLSITGSPSKETATKPRSNGKPLKDFVPRPFGIFRHDLLRRGHGQLPKVKSKTTSNARNSSSTLWKTNWPIKKLEDSTVISTESRNSLETTVPRFSTTANQSTTVDLSRLSITGSPSKELVTKTEISGKPLKDFVPRAFGIFRHDFLRRGHEPIPKVKSKTTNNARTSSSTLWKTDWPIEKLEDSTVIFTESRNSKPKETTVPRLSTTAIELFTHNKWEISVTESPRGTSKESVTKAEIKRKPLPDSVGDFLGIFRYDLPGRRRGQLPKEKPKIIGKAETSPSTLTESMSDSGTQLSKTNWPKENLKESTMIYRESTSNQPLETLEASVTKTGDKLNGKPVPDTVRHVFGLRDLLGRRRVKLPKDKPKILGDATSPSTLGEHKTDRPIEVFAESITKISPESEGNQPVETSTPVSSSTTTTSELNPSGLSFTESHSTTSKKLVAKAEQPKTFVPHAFKLFKFDLLGKRVVKLPKIITNPKISMSSTTVRESKTKWPSDTIISTESTNDTTNDKTSFNFTQRYSTSNTLSSLATYDSKSTSGTSKESTKNTKSIGHDLRIFRYDLLKRRRQHLPKENIKTSSIAENKYTTVAGIFAELTTISSLGISNSGSSSVIQSNTPLATTEPEKKSAITSPIKKLSEESKPKLLFGPFVGILRRFPRDETRSILTSDSLKNKSKIIVREATTLHHIPLTLIASESSNANQPSSENQLENNKKLTTFKPTSVSSNSNSVRATEVTLEFDKALVPKLSSIHSKETITFQAESPTRSVFEPTTHLPSKIITDHPIYKLHEDSLTNIFETTKIDAAKSSAEKYATTFQPPKVFREVSLTTGQGRKDKLGFTTKEPIKTTRLLEGSNRFARRSMSYHRTSKMYDNSPSSSASLDLTKNTKEFVTTGFSYSTSVKDSKARKGLMTRNPSSERFLPTQSGGTNHSTDMLVDRSSISSAKETEPRKSTLSVIPRVNSNPSVKVHNPNRRDCRFGTRVLVRVKEKGKDGLVQKVICSPRLRARLFRKRP